MALFVDVSEYLDYFGLDEADTGRALVDLDAACDRIRAYLNQRIDAVDDEVVTLRGNDTRALLLPELPVTSVTSVVLDATTLNSAETLTPGTGYTIDSAGVLWRSAPYWWLQGATYTVTYSHGYTAATIPAILKVAAFRLAKLGSASSGGAVSSETVGPFSVSYSSSETQGSVLSDIAPFIVKRIPMA